MKALAPMSCAKCFGRIDPGDELVVVAGGNFHPAHTPAGAPMTPDDRAEAWREVDAYDALPAPERLAPGARERYLGVHRALWDDERSRPGSRPASLTWPEGRDWDGGAA